MQLTYPPSCDNAPKKRLLISLMAAWTKNEGALWKQHLHSKFQWEKIGAGQFDASALLSYIQSSHQHLSSISIASVLTHGAEASVSGKMLYEDGTILAFAHLMRFKSAGSNEIVFMQSFLVQAENS
jgi:hypothetical protein